MAYECTDVFLIAYDMTCRSSLEDVVDWLEEIQDYMDEDGDYYRVILVGTKYDLWLEKEDGDDAVCTEEAIAEMAAEIGEQQLLCHSIFTSAKTGYGLTIESRHVLQHGVDATGEAPTLDKLIMQVYADLDLIIDLDRVAAEFEQPEQPDCAKD